jgi:hypothetical protein
MSVLGNAAFVAVLRHETGLNGRPKPGQKDDRVASWATSRARHPVRSFPNLDVSAEKSCLAEGLPNSVDKYRLSTEFDIKQIKNE